MRISSGTWRAGTSSATLGHSNNSREACDFGSDHDDSSEFDSRYNRGGTRMRASFVRKEDHNMIGSRSQHFCMFNVLLQPLFTEFEYITMQVQCMRFTWSSLQFEVKQP